MCLRRCKSGGCTVHQSLHWHARHSATASVAGSVQGKRWGVVERCPPNTAATAPVRRPSLDLHSRQLGSTFLQAMHVPFSCR